MAGEQKIWYALYCKARNEKKVHGRLLEAGIEAYLPLLKTMKQWSDRKKWVEEPLFKSYLFVHILKSEYYRVLDVPGVVRYVTFEGKAVPVPPGQILAIQQYLGSEADLPGESEDFIIGDRVEIFRGNLKGMMGQMTEIRGKQKVRIEIECVGQSIFLTIPKSYLKIIS